MKQPPKPADADMATSKFLSFILRHKPESIGLRLDSEGWADINDLLRLAAGHGRHISHDHLVRVVAGNDKKRFAISEDSLRVRAVQGHSASQVAIRFTPRIPPETLFHGTAQRFMESIRARGLMPSDRQYVHLSPDPATALSVGKRHGKPTVLIVHAAAMTRDGFLYYLSENGIWLTRNVPAKYLEELPRPG